MSLLIGSTSGRCAYRSIDFEDSLRVPDIFEIEVRPESGNRLCSCSVGRCILPLLLLHLCGGRLHRGAGCHGRDVTSAVILAHISPLQSGVEVIPTAILHKTLTNDRSVRLDGVRMPASERHSCGLPTLLGRFPADSLHPGSCICWRAVGHICSATASTHSSVADPFLPSEAALQCCYALSTWRALSWQSHFGHWSSAVWPLGRGGADRCNTLVCVEFCQPAGTPDHE